MIVHYPRLDTQKVIELYENKDQTTIVYVCTTDLATSDLPIDIFYRESPHPEFGNRYFGLYTRDGVVMICNADQVEKLEFGMVKDSAGNLHYSQSHHDYKVLDNGNMIDGGRAYIRSSNCTAVYRVKDGELCEQTNLYDIDENKNIMMSSN